MKLKNFAAAMSAAVLMFIPCGAFAKVGGGDIEYNPKGAGKVVFRHEYHVSLKGQKCTNCHYKAFQMSKGSYKMDMQKLTKGQFCGVCHNGKNTFDLTSSNNCKRCHQE